MRLFNPAGSRKQPQLCLNSSAMSEHRLYEQQSDVASTVCTILQQCSDTHYLTAWWHRTMAEACGLTRYFTGFLHSARLARGTVRSPSTGNSKLPDSLLIACNMVRLSCYLQNPKISCSFYPGYADGHEFTPRRVLQD